MELLIIECCIATDSASGKGSVATVSFTPVKISSQRSQIGKLSYGLETDASESGSGATLKNGNKIINTWSFQWSEAESNMSSNSRKILSFYENNCPALRSLVSPLIPLFIFGIGTLNCIASWIHFGYTFSLRFAYDSFGEGLAAIAQCYTS
ncbi:hypothetical protein ACTFIV_007910 [Dictyostelium citrinum]